MALRVIPRVVEGLNGVKTVRRTSQSGGDVASGANLDGPEIDLDSGAIGANFAYATPFVVGGGYASVAGNRRITVDVQLLHSSTSGGTFTRYRSDQGPQPASFYESTGGTAGAIRIQSAPGAISLQGCGRYIKLRVVVTLGNTSGTGAAAAGELVSVMGGFIFTHADEELPRPVAASAAS